MVYSNPQPGYCIPNHKENPEHVSNRFLIMIFSCVGNCKNDVENNTHSYDYYKCASVTALLTVNNIFIVLILHQIYIYKYCYLYSTYDWKIIIFGLCLLN